MINYDCETINGSFVIAKRSGWAWSQKEQELPFVLVRNVPMHQADEDYQVEILPGLWVWASQIDEALITSEE